MEWFGFFIMTLNLGTFSFFIWTFVNLVPRSISNHKWYKETFNDYPKERKYLFLKYFNMDLNKEKDIDVNWN